MINIPIYRAKSKERKNSYVDEGLLIGVDEELNLCTIRTKDDYIGGEICYLHTLSIHFPDMIDSQGNKINGRHHLLEQQILSNKNSINNRVTNAL